MLRTLLSCSFSLNEVSMFNALRMERTQLSESGKRPMYLGVCECLCVCVHCSKWRQHQKLIFRLLSGRTNACVELRKRIVVFPEEGKKSDKLQQFSSLGHWDLRKVRSDGNIPRAEALQPYLETSLRMELLTKKYIISTHSGSCKSDPC